MNRWQTKSSKVVYDNPWLSVHEDQVIRPDGSDGIYGIVSRKSRGVFVVPIDENGDTYIVSQERYATKQESWEFVAGGVEENSWEDAAKRELLEEAGIRAEKVEKVSEFFPVVGFSDAKGIICIATDIKKVSDGLDPVDGILAVRKVSFDEIKRMAISGEITDGSTITAAYMALAYLEQQTS